MLENLKMLFRVSSPWIRNRIFRINYLGGTARALFLLRLNFYKQTTPPEFGVMDGPIGYNLLVARL